MPDPNFPKKSKTEPTGIPYQPLSPLFGAAVLGILVDRALGPPLFLWTLAVPVTLFAGLLAHRNKRPVWASLFILATGVSLFGLRHHVQWNRFPHNDLGFYAREIGTPLALRGRVIEMPRILPPPASDPGRVFEVPERTLLTLRARSLRDGPEWIKVDGRVSLVIEGGRDDLRVGDSIQVFGILSRPTGPQNPGDFDYAEMLRGNRILCIVRAASSEAVEVLRKGRPGPGRFLEALRRAGRSNLERRMPPETAPYATAMLLGLREGVDEDTTQGLMETGTMHILAISGLHIGLAAAMVGALLWFFGVSRRPSAVMLVLVVLTYLVLTDVRPPAIRATVLVCVVSAAMYSGRRIFGLNTLCATALIVLIWNPTELFHFGAQLSFLATGAFLWIPRPETVRRFLFRSKKTEDATPSRFSEVEVLERRPWIVVRLASRSIGSLAELFLISLIVWGVTMPLILERIHLFTPIALLVNPLLWFPLTAALLAGFLTMIFGAVPILGPLFGQAATLSFDALFGMIACFRDLGGHYWVPGPPAWWNAIFYTVFVALTFLPLRRPRPRVLAAILLSWIAVGFGAGLIRDLDRRWNDRLTVSVFSVGHGNCVLITTPRKKTIVYDVGCISSPKRGADILSRGLWRLGKTRIDAIVVTHPDDDHFNGVIRLTDRFDIGSLLVSPYMFEKPTPALERLRETLRLKGIPLNVVAEGDDLTSFGLPDSTFLHPPRSGFDASDETNATSLVLRFAHHGVGVLLPGDLDGRQPSPFLDRKPIRSEIVLLPHHGGRSKQTERLLKWASPRTLIVSEGRFTHRDEVLNDFRKRGYTVRSTFEEGYIEISLDKHHKEAGASVPDRIQVP